MKSRILLKMITKARIAHVEKSDFYTCHQFFKFKLGLSLTAKIQLDYFRWLLQSNYFKHKDKYTILVNLGPKQYSKKVKMFKEFLDQYDEI